jgi:predicted TIM-barrel fold metal-dependent hydrolase
MHLVGQYRSGNKLVNDFDAATGNLIALMDQYGLARSLIVVVPTHYGQSGEADYEVIRAMVKLHPDRLHLMAGGATLGPMIYETDAAAITPELQKEFEAKADKLITAGAKGFGEMLALHLCLSETHSFYNTPPDHPLYLLLADIAARHGVPIDLHMEAVPEDVPMPANLTQACDKNPATLPATIPAFERLLSHNRDTKIVWQHIGWDNTGYMTIDLVRRLLDDHPNLYIALKIEVRGHQVGPAREPMPNRIVDEKWQVRPEWLEFISEYPDRIMIGADEFVGVSGRAVHGAPSFSQTWDIIDQLPSDLAGQVGRDNAARVYNLGQ